MTAMSPACWFCGHDVTSDRRICPLNCGCHAHYSRAETTHRVTFARWHVRTPNAGRGFTERHVEWSPATGYVCRDCPDRADRCEHVQAVTTTIKEAQ